MLRRSLGWGALACAAAFVASSCGSGAEYITNRSAETYFKVPKNWTAQQINGDAEPLGFYDFLREGAWSVVFTPNVVDPVQQLVEPQPGVPRGLVVIGQLEQPAYDTITATLLRAIPVTAEDGSTGLADPIELYQAEDDNLRIYAFETITRNGLRGHRIRYAYRDNAESPFVMYDWLRLVHDATGLYYYFQIMCEASCFAANQRDIDVIVSSLRIREDQS